MENAAWFIHQHPYRFDFEQDGRHEKYELRVWPAGASCDIQPRRALWNKWIISTTLSCSPGDVLLRVRLF
jgi:hypothetical protein